MDLQECLEAIRAIEADARRAGNPDLVLCHGHHRFGHDVFVTGRADEARSIVSRWLNSGGCFSGERGPMLAAFVQPARVQVLYSTGSPTRWAGLDGADNRFAPRTRWERHFAELGCDAEYVPNTPLRHVLPTVDGAEPEVWTRCTDGITRGLFNGRVWEVRWRPWPPGGQRVGTAPTEVRVDGGPWFLGERSFHGTLRSVEAGLFTDAIIASIVQADTTAY